MELPSEEQIEAVISELQVGASLAHNVKEDDDCELCHFLHEMSNRAKKELPAIDQLSMNILEKPEAFIVKLMTGDGLAEDVIYYIRTAFYIGLKVGFVKGLDHRVDEE